MSKLLSELPVGSLVKDTSTEYNGQPIIFRILEHGHTGDPSGSTTLDTRDIISLKCFDAREPNNNSNSDRQNYGNNRYAYSNLLHWLNSNETNWYTAKHQTDHEPSYDCVWSNGNNPINPYASESGFLTNFSSELRNALQTVTKRTALAIVDGGGYEDYEDVQSKLFLLSTTEAGLANENSIAEGSIYSYYSTDGANRRKKNLANEDAKGNYSSATNPWYWWLRTPYSSNSCSVRRVCTDGSLDYGDAYYGGYGVSPAFCLLSSQKVSDTTDDDGAYVLEWNAAPTITTSSNSLGYQYNPFSVTFTVSDAEGDSVTVTTKIDNGQAETLAGSNGSYTYTIDSTAFGDLALGSHTITISASDGVNTATQNITFTKATNANPTVTPDNTNMGYQTQGFTFGYTVIDTDGDSCTVTLELDGNVVQTNSNVASGTRLTYEVATVALGLLSGGTHTFTITAEDGKYGVGQATATFSVLNLNGESDNKLVTLGQVKAIADAVLNKVAAKLSAIENNGD